MDQSICISSVQEMVPVWAQVLWRMGKIYYKFTIFCLWQLDVCPVLQRMNAVCSLAAKLLSARQVLQNAEGLYLPMKSEGTELTEPLLGGLKPCSFVCPCFPCVRSLSRSLWAAEAELSSAALQTRPLVPGVPWWGRVELGGRTGGVLTGGQVMGEQKRTHSAGSPGNLTWQLLFLWYSGILNQLLFFFPYNI